MCIQVLQYHYGFDELGEHGALDVNLEKNNADIKFIKLDDKEFVEKEINVSDVNTEEELIEALNSYTLDENKFYKFILTGNKNFEINTNKVLKRLSFKNLIKIKDKAKLGFDLEKISKENSLKGFFIREILEMKDSNAYSEDEINKAIEIGLTSLKI